MVQPRGVVPTILSSAVGVCRVVPQRLNDSANLYPVPFQPLFYPEADHDPQALSGNERLRRRVVGEGELL